MLALRVSDPASHPAALAAAGEVLRRAADEAGAVPGAYARAPWAFVTPDADAARLLDAAMGPGPGGWVVVTCRGTGDEAEDGHLHERSRTAVQRFLLSLDAENVRASWTPEVPDGLAAALGIGPRDAVLGVVRWQTD